MEYTIASLAHRAIITREILAHCAGLRAVGRERLAETIEGGDYGAHLNYNREIVNGIMMLRAALERDDTSSVGSTIADVAAAFNMMLRGGTVAGRVAGGTENSVYSAARLEASSKWVAVDNAIDALRSGR